MTYWNRAARTILAFAACEIDRAVCHDIVHFAARVLATVVAVSSATPFAVDFSGGLAASGSAPVTSFPSRRPARAHVGYWQVDASRPPASVPAGSQKLAGLAVTLPIRFRSCLACLLPRGFQLLGNVVPVLEVHLVRRLPLER